MRGLGTDSRPLYNLRIMKQILMPLMGAGMLLSLFACEDAKKSEEQEKETPNSFVLNADIKGIEDKYLFYLENDDQAENGQRIDTLWIEDDKFSFTDSISEQKMYFITVPQATRSYVLNIGGKEYTVSTKANVNRLWFIGYPGAEISYKGAVEDHIVNAYPSDKDGINDDLAVIHKTIFPLIDQSNALSEEMGTKTLSDAEKENMRAKQDSLYQVIKKHKIDFVKSHPKSIAASYIFSDMFYRKELEKEDAKTLFASLDTNTLKGTSFYDEVEMRFKAMEDTKLGKPAPEFVTENTQSGKTFNLSDLKGNYVLLDYWGTWCGPCMAEMPKIKEISTKYKDENFIVVGVNQGDPVNRWKSAIEKNDFSWTHIRTTDENDLRIPFNVNSFPTKILIDPDGNIAYSSKNDDGIDLYELLDDIFKKS